MTLNKDSGINVIGMIPWGTHFCVFYNTKEDLTEVLVPYFEAGLRNNEYCMWVTSDHLNADEVKARMARTMPDINKFFESGQIEVIPYTEWYITNGVFNSERVLNGWVERLQKAKAMGYSGLRLTGDTSWLEKADWEDFQGYEREINDAIGNYDMIALCTYPLDKYDAGDVLDVASTHQFVLCKREDRWTVIESQEQIKARKILQESDVRFRSLIQNSSDIIRIIDKEGHIIFDSPSSVKILGYPPDYMLGKSPLDYVHPDDVERVRNDLSQVIHSRNSGTPTEFRIRKADGRYLDVESIGVNMVGVQGVDGVVITTRPITERKRVEENLRMMSKAVEDSPATVVVTDIDGNIEYVNPKFTQLTGYTFEEARGKNPRILKSGQTPPEEYKQLWDTILSGHEWRGEFLNRKKDGELYWESAIISPIRDDKGKITRFIAVKEDITERKRMEASLKLSRFSMDHAQDMIFWLRPDGSFEYINKSARSRYGYNYDDLRSLTIFDLNPGYTKGSWEAHWRSLRDKGSLFYNTTNKTKDGSVFPVEISASYIMYENKELLLAFVRDITERKRAEEELMDAKMRVEMYLDLMGHDINNINQVAMGYLELANEILALDDEKKELVSTPLEALRSSATLIENVRKLQMLKEGGLKLDRIDLKETLSGLQTYYRNADSENVAIDFESKDGCYVMANGLIVDVFTNLIGNAIKHSNIRKQVEIKVKVDKVPDNGKDHCMVTVEDNGPGIQDDLKDKIFNRFQRGETKASGKGLGLYLVKTLVNDFHGNVWVEDRVTGDYTKGSRFVVMIPALE